MRFYVGITDRDWFDHVLRIEALDEVYLWQENRREEVQWQSVSGVLTCVVTP